MPDTIKDRLSKAVKPAVDYAKNLYTQGKALVQPLPKDVGETLQINSKQIKQFKDDEQKPAAKPSGFKKGGKVRKTGIAKVHKGERVLTTGQTKKFAAKGGLRSLYGDTDKDGK